MRKSKWKCIEKLRNGRYCVRPEYKNLKCKTHWIAPEEVELLSKSNKIIKRTESKIRRLLRSSAGFYVVVKDRKYWVTTSSKEGYIIDANNDDWKKITKPNGNVNLAKLIKFYQ